MQSADRFLPETQLQPPLSYNITLIIAIVAAILAVCGILYLVIKAIQKKRKKPKPALREPVSPKDAKNIKQKYIARCNQLGLELENKRITLRHGYQRLNDIIRFFAFEMTGIKLQNCALSDIEKLNMPTLHALVKEYYHPEFAEISIGDISMSLEKTRKVIELWN